MQITISENYFIDQFMAIRPDNFSRQGLSMLFEYLEQWEIDTGVPIEFDPIAICCDYSENEIEDIIRDYDIEITSDDPEEEVMDYLNEHTFLLGKTELGTLVYQQF